jgi:DNA-binding transcriptional LysR family regulator
MSTSRIRLLEEELGVQLFVRHSRGVEPSEAGLRLLSYVEQIRAPFQQAITAVKEDGTAGVPGKLCIRGSETNWYGRSHEWHEESGTRLSRL